MHVFRKRVSICVCASFPIGLEGRMVDLRVLVPVTPFLFASDESPAHPLLSKSEILGKHKEAIFSFG